MKRHLHIRPISNRLPKSELLRSLPAWQIERATRLHRQFIRVERAQQKGKAVNAALRHFAWYWRGATFRTAPHLKVHFSLLSLRRIFYKWKRAGRTPECIALRYGSHLAPSPTPAHLARYLNAIADPRIMTMHEAFVKVAATLPFKWRKLQDALPKTLRNGARRLLFFRRHQRSEERRFARARVRWETNQGRTA